MSVVHSRLTTAISLLICTIFGVSSLYGQGTWVPIASFAPHYNAGVMLLLTDGTVLCKTSSGGGQGIRWDRLTPDASGSYVNGTWSTVAPMAEDRLYFSSQVLRDGRVYVAGGEYGNGGDDAEVFDPVSNSWTQCPKLVHSLTYKISDANSEILPDGKVLQSLVDTGSTKLNYIWDPATNTYAQTASCLRRNNEASWVKLPDNSILFLDNYSTTAERYIPSTGTWVNDASAPVNLYDPYGSEAGGAFLLPNGKLFFIGSTPNSAYYTPTGTSSPGTWLLGPPIPFNQGAPDAASAMMVNGKILLAVSQTPTSADHFPDSTVFYEFDYTTNAYTRVHAPGSTSDTLLQPSFITNMLCLPDGSILFANQGDDQYYEYQPSGSPLAAGKPTISQIIGSSCTDFMITGTLFNGITEGACYGDDWQNSTNYPIVRFTSGSNVYYAKTTNWNSTGVMRGASLDTAYFTLPVGIPNGSYTVEVVANGNPSAPFPLVIGPPASITGPSTVCIGSNVNLTDATSGGVWSSGVTSLATVTSGGVVTGVGAGSVDISYTRNGCGVAKTIVVNSLPGNITGTLTVCAGLTTSLSDAGGGTWSSGSTSVASVSGSGLVTGLAVGTSNITYTLSTGCNTVSTVTVNLTATPITGSGNICVGAITSLTNATTGGAWLSGNPLVATIDASGNVSGVGTGTANITYQVGAGCRAITVVTVNTTPAAITGPSNVCAGGTAAMSDATIGGAWSSMNTSIATIDPVSGLLAGVTAGATSVSYTLGTCAAGTVINVNTSPSAITGTTSVCTGDITVLSDAVGLGSWKSSNTAIATVAGGSVSGVTAGTATITYSLGTGCETTTGITVNPLPNALSGNPAICLGLTSALSSTSLGGAWNSSNTSVATVSGSGVVTGAALGTSAITYSLPTGCFTTANVSVNSAPSSSITGSTVFCAGTTSTLSNATPGGVWISSMPSVAVAGSSSGVITGVSAGTSEISYSLGAGCEAVTTVTVLLAPAAITGGTSVCVGSAASLSDATSLGAWTSSNTAVATVSGSGLVSGISGGTSTIFYTLATGCAATVVMNVGAPVVAPISGSSNACISQPVALSDATPAGVWSSSNTARATVSPLGVVTGVSAGTVIISYKVTSACGAASATQVMTVNPLPVVGAVTGSSKMCVLGSVALSCATTGGVWSSSAPSVASVAGTGLVSGWSSGTATISYTVTSGAGCSSAATATEVVNNPIAAVITPASSTSFCTGGFVRLNATLGSGYTYQWQVGGSDISGATSSGYTVNYSGNFTVVIDGPSICASLSPAVVVTVNPMSIVVPSVVVNATPGTTLCMVTSPVTFTPTPANGGTAPVYDWYVNGGYISTAPSLSYSPAHGDNVKCVMTSNATCAFPDTGVNNVSVSIIAPVAPAVSVMASPGDTVCSGKLTTFSPVPVYGGSSPVYSWTKNGVGVGTYPSYSYIPADGDVIACSMISNYFCTAFSTVNSADFTIHVKAPTTNSVTVYATKPAVASGQVDTFVAIAPHAGSSPLYQWYLNGTAIPGATNPTYVTSSLVDGDMIKCSVTSSDICATPATGFSVGYKVRVGGTGVKVVLNEAGNFSLVPNPTAGVFTISGELKSAVDDRVGIVVTNMLGQVVYKTVDIAENGNLDKKVALGSDIANGTYLVTVTSGEDHAVFHLVLNR